MQPMRCPPALGLASALLLALGAAACGKDEPRMPATCTTTDLAGYERALRAAPGAVRLPGDVPISTCLRRVRTDAQLQELGTVVHGVAEDLAGRADGGDAAAAGQLGYLTGAVAAGARRSNGISAELARRVAIAGTRLGDDPELARALAAGTDAGQAHG
jgi:hypothetical protein